MDTSIGTPDAPKLVYSILSISFHRTRCCFILYFLFHFQEEGDSEMEMILGVAANSSARFCLELEFVEMLSNPKYLQRTSYLCPLTQWHMLMPWFACSFGECSFSQSSPLSSRCHRPCGAEIFWRRPLSPLYWISTVLERAQLRCARITPARALHARDASV